METKIRNIIIGIIVGVILVIVIALVLIFTLGKGGSVTTDCNKPGTLCGDGRVCGSDQMCRNCQSDDDCNQLQKGYKCNIQTGKCVPSSKNRDDVIIQYSLVCPQLINFKTGAQYKNKEICFFSGENIPVKSIDGVISGMKCYSIPNVNSYFKTTGSDTDDILINNPAGVISQDKKYFYPADDDNILWIKQKGEDNIVCPILESLMVYDYQVSTYFYVKQIPNPLVNTQIKLYPSISLSSNNQGNIVLSWGLNDNMQRIYLSTDYGYTFIDVTPVELIYNNSTYSFSRTCVSPRDGKYQLFTTSTEKTAQLYVSNDFGKTWRGISNVNIFVGNCCMSYDGKYQIAVSYNGIWRSEDYGNTFIYIEFPRAIDPSVCPTKDSASRWLDLSNPGNYQKCTSDEVMTGLCGGGGDKDCRSSSGKPIQGRIKCTKVGNLPWYNSNKHSSNSYNADVYCSNQSVGQKVCMSGKHSDCDGGNTRKVIGCVGNWDLDKTDIKTQPLSGDGKGKNLECPAGYILTGFCNGGSDHDCKGGKYFTWLQCTKCNGFLPQLYLQGVATNYEGDLVYVQRGYFYYYSTDYGKTFKMIKNINNISSFVMTYDGSKIFTIAPDGLYVSTDNNNKGGKFTTKLSDLPDKSFTNISCSPSGNIVSLYKLNSAGVYVSLDGGKTWKVPSLQ